MRGGFVEFSCLEMTQWSFEEMGVEDPGQVTVCVRVCACVRIHA